MSIADGQGHAVSDPTNVINAVAFFIDFSLTSTGGDTGGDLTFTGVRDFHFSSGNGIPPPPSGQKTDPSIADKMPQLILAISLGLAALLIRPSPIHSRTTTIGQSTFTLRSDTDGLGITTSTAASAVG